jgi:hypothetical protein
MGSGSGSCFVLLYFIAQEPNIHDGINKVMDLLRKVLPEEQAPTSTYHKQTDTPKSSTHQIHNGPHH